MQSVTKRWMLNFLTIIVVILTVIMLLIVVGVREFYYSSAQQVLTSRIEVMVNAIKYRTSDALTPQERVEQVITGFEEKTKYEVMALDRDGNPTVTSSGFYPGEAFTGVDYARALQSDNGYGVYTGRAKDAGNVMSVCYVSDSLGDGVGGIRLVCDLSLVDGEIFKTALFFLLFSTVVVLFVVLSSTYFIRSIVTPIGQVGVIATKIASGDFSVRLKTQHNDEIGQLCNIINYMADELQKAEEVKNDFISQVSHELRTPLTAIKGWGETVLDADPVENRDTVERGIHVILSETDRLSGMVEELLDFSRMQSGRLTLVLSKIDVLAELEDVLIMFGERAKREGVTLESELPEFVSPVFGDRNRLRQVFVNILDNALKYSEKDGVIRTSAAEETGYVVIRIADTGLGIPRSDLPHIKEKFIKGANSRRGTGIGLAVADEIIALHKGLLTIDSTEGEGTTVTISIPVMDKKVDSTTMQIAKIDEEEIRRYREQQQRDK
ncbi:HAMP domain-containing sensor histidine kinase [Bittarella massiliensis (ex Durand et al. 2017)]|uniref:HAMP domain-containing sensor histidine kinase n=1 Tax=Bittarella massiliensis (ex Durand et al. 2017) TaxID=1720313 RepID=UPI001AA12CAB|nr:HAMP domain-containing sensor histidine kinase [Bittarella massiliensis (ex Durand et al. 2017)]MBO1680616.1 HAMP domain-containing histidine kinase [Bittarella massiliensis (ex Durand et al. 2017)]